MPLFSLLFLLFFLFSLFLLLLLFKFFLFLLLLARPLLSARSGCAEAVIAAPLQLLVGHLPHLAIEQFIALATARFGRAISTRALLGRAIVDLEKPHEAVLVARVTACMVRDEGRMGREGG